MIRAKLSDQFSEKKSNTIYNRDTESEVDGSAFLNSFYFGNMGDDSRLFFHLEDGSIWDYWLDDGSVGKITATFDELIVNSEVILKDDWNKFLNEY